MTAVRMRGLVRLARLTKQQFALPMSPQQVLSLRRRVQRALGAVARGLSDCPAGPGALPALSRRACEFLRELDADGYPHHDAEHLGVPPVVVPRWPGVRGRWTLVLRGMAREHTAYDDETYAELRVLSETVECSVTAAGSGGIWLDAAQRAVRGWLRYFAQRDHYEAYRAAVARATPSIERAMHRHCAPGTYPWLCFQPVRGLFRRHQTGPRLRLMLPTPMFSFDEQGFEAVALAALAGGPRAALREATRSPTYRAMQAELDTLGAENLARPLGLVWTDS